MSSTYSILAWSPLLIGLMFSSFMYGSTLGQFIYYSYWFPDDHRFIKLLVVCVTLGETAHLIGTVQLCWTFFISCHGGDLSSCSNVLPWGGLTMVCLITALSFMVHCFYCRRIWAISAKNKILTFIVFLVALLRFAAGTWLNVDVARVGTIQYLFQCPLILPSAGMGALCDILIACSVFKYMWRSGLKRKRRSIIQDLAIVCINMGVLTCLVSIITGIIYLAQGDGFWVAAVGTVISHCYANSMMAVLNARKVVRDRDPGSIELITLPA